jgi:glycerol-3-phosphate acyltransferase PlsY
VTAILPAALALLVGYLAGSIPVAALVGRTAGAGADVVRVGDGRRRPDATDVWRLTGRGTGLLALAGELATGLLPVAVGIVSWSWAAGWAAGLGAVAGACWPFFGRRPGGRGVMTLAGALYALSPAAGTIALLVGLAVLGLARPLGRDGRAAATAAGFTAFPLLLLADEMDPGRLAAVLVLYVVVAIRALTARR